jgi:molecular chaperone GrpE
VTNAEAAGPGDQSGPAEEQQPEETVQAEATMGEGTPTNGGTGPTEPKVDETAADAVVAEVITGDVVTEEPKVETETKTGTKHDGKAGKDKGGLGAELEALRSELDERLRDLQRISAEYANYRRRVERDRSAVVEQSTALVISALLPVLDDLDRAREHDDLVGPAAAMAEQLSAALAKFGLTGFGEAGDRFDPTRHEAVAHQTSDEVTEPTCVTVMRRGYLLGDRLLRAALVAVADPE